jgi:hypothetical protein
VPDRPSLLEELGVQYEEARQSTHEHADVETFQAIDARLRKAFRWLEKAITYLDELKPPIDHRFDLGHGLVFESLRFGHGSVGQHERRIVGFPVLTNASGCEERLALGDTWAHLRLCRTCGHVGCCDHSKNRHASRDLPGAGRGLELVLHRRARARARMNENATNVDL